MQRPVPLSVLILNNVPAPYFDPLFEQIGARSGWQLTVCYSSAWNRDVGWDEKNIAGCDAYRTIILDRVNPRLTRVSGSSLAAAVALAKVMFAEKPDYLLCYGYTLMPQITALLIAILTSTRFAVAGDANYFNDLGRAEKKTPSWQSGNQEYEKENIAATEITERSVGPSGFFCRFRLFHLLSFYLRAIRARIKRWARRLWLRL